MTDFAEKFEESVAEMRRARAAGKARPVVHHKSGSSVRVQAPCVDAAGIAPPGWQDLCRFQMVDVDSLVVDPTYQRQVGRNGARLVKRLVETFDWPSFGAVLVAERTDGTLALVDGQHRVAAARQLGLGVVPAIVTGAREAALFLATNRDRLRLEPYQLFHAGLAAGEAEAVALNEILQCAGVVVPRAKSNAGAGPGQTFAVSVLRACLRAHGQDVLERALSAMVDAWGTIPNALCAAEVRAICRVVVAANADPKWRARYLAETLRALDPARLRDDAAAAAGLHGGAVWKHMARLIANALSAAGHADIAIGVD